MGFDWRQVKAGDTFMVKEEFLTRGGKFGDVVGNSASAEGVTLDFYCDAFGDPRGLPTIEWWEWDELELPETQEEPNDR